MKKNQTFLANFIFFDDLDGGKIFKMAVCLFENWESLLSGMLNDSVDPFQLFTEEVADV